MPSLSEAEHKKDHKTVAISAAQETRAEEKIRSDVELAKAVFSRPTLNVMMSPCRFNR
jgi:hypothetical protein